MYNAVHYRRPSLRPVIMSYQRSSQGSSRSWVTNKLSLLIALYDCYEQIISIDCSQLGIRLRQLEKFHTRAAIDSLTPFDDTRLNEHVRVSYLYPQTLYRIRYLDIIPSKKRTWKANLCTLYFCPSQVMPMKVRSIHLPPVSPFTYNIQGVPVLKVHIYIFQFKNKNGVKNYIRKIL